MPAIEIVSSSGFLHKKALRLMGNRFEITVVIEKESEAVEHINAAVNEISRIEALLTTFNEDSETALINRHAGEKPVAVSPEVFELIKRSKRISDLTQGAFDISYGSVDKKLWNFDSQMTALPDPVEAKKMVRLINYRHIVLDEKEGTVFLKEKGMRIGFGGIGKGYAAEKAKEVLKERGVNNGIVNASGDLTVWGFQPDGKKWTIGIADPERAGQPFSFLNVTDTAIATSGNYEKFVMIGGKKYSHTINPKTGLPVHGIKSATIICPNAEIADALATPVMIMGVKVGLDMIDQMHGISCILVDDEDKVYTSKNINLL
jgi:thiamine biosynthesis lipoprotein